ncbi:MAG: 50S ribosomal protein L4 [candidate division Zixibacteria bacterium]|nr:50S ribosomal protein L4 [candidate division Zixibacteria bacterium]
MSITVIKADGSEGSKITLPESVFGIEPNEVVVHSYVVNYLANQRQGNAATKTRGEVNGGGAKPWRQKGTGRARAGTIRSPLWRGGGTVFGPQPRCYYNRMPKKQKRLALLSVFSDKAQRDRVKILENLEISDSKTKNMVALMNTLELSGRKVLFLDEGVNPNPYVASRNIPGIKISRACLANTYDVLHADYVVITMSGLKEIEEVFA